MKPDQIKKAIRSRLQGAKGNLFWSVLYLIGMFIYTAIMFGLAIGAVSSLVNFKRSHNYYFAQG